MHNEEHPTKWSNVRVSPTNRKTADLGRIARTVTLSDVIIFLFPFREPVFVECVLMHQRMRISIKVEFEHFVSYTFGLDVNNLRANIVLLITYSIDVAIIFKRTRVLIQSESEYIILNNNYSDGDSRWFRVTPVRFPLDYSTFRSSRIGNGTSSWIIIHFQMEINRSRHNSNGKCRRRIIHSHFKCQCGYFIECWMKKFHAQCSLDIIWASQF